MINFMIDNRQSVTSMCRNFYENQNLIEKTKVKKRIICKKKTSQMLNEECRIAS